METKTTDTSVLVVDDDKATIEMLTMLLKKNGFDVRTAGNGSEALDFIKERSYDIVITDLKMPDLDGYELLDIVKTRHREHKVMVMTADIFKREQLLRKGALEAFAKPFSLNTFVDDLKTLINERRRTKRFLSIEKIHCLVKGTDGKVVAEGILSDISIDGALIDLNTAPPKLQEVVLHFSPEKAADKVFCEVAGQIVRVIKKDKDNPDRIAVYFADDRDMELLNHIEEYIQLKSSSYLT